MAQEIVILDPMGDDYATGDISTEGWSSSGTSISPSVVSGRTGNAIGFNATGASAMWRNFTADDHPHIAFAWKVSTVAFDLPTNVLEFKEGGSTVHGRLTINADGTLTISRAGSIPATSANLGGWVADTWYHFEVDYYIHDSNGFWEVRFGGNSTPVIGRTTGLDTRNAGTSGVCDNFVFNGVTSTARSTYIDDVVYAAGGGSSAGAFYGDVRIFTSLPTGDGNSTQWTRSTGSSDFGVVDESTPNGDTDYISEATSGDLDLFTFPAVGFTGTVQAVGLRAWSRKDDSGSRQLKLTTRSSGTNYDHSLVDDLSISYLPVGCRNKHGIWETNPAGGAWTVTAVNAAEFGVKAG